MNSKENKYSSNISLSGKKNKVVKSGNEITDNNSYQKSKHQSQHHHKHHHQSNDSIGDNKGKQESNEMNVSLKKHKQSSFTGSNLSFKHHSKNNMGSKQSLNGNDMLKYRRTKLTQIDVNSSNYAEIIRLTALLDESYAKIKELTSENKKLLTNQKVQERALKSTNDMVGDYPKTVEKLMEDIRILKAQNKKYAEKLVSLERAQAKKVAIQNNSDNAYELKEKYHRLHEELEKQKQKMVEYEKRDEKYQKMYDQLVKRTKLCKEKIAENKVLAQKNQRLEKDIVKLRENYEIVKKQLKIQNNSLADKNRLTFSKADIHKNDSDCNSKDSDLMKNSNSDSLSRRTTQTNFNKIKKDMSSNSNTEEEQQPHEGEPKEEQKPMKKPRERKPKTLQRNENLNENLKKEDSDKSKSSSIDKDKENSSELKNNEEADNFEDLYSDDFDAIEDDDQKFFMPSQEESLKPSTLFKPNLYYSANCSPEPDAKENDNDNLIDNEIQKEKNDDNEGSREINRDSGIISPTKPNMNFPYKDNSKASEKSESDEYISKKKDKNSNTNANMLTDTLLSTKDDENNNGASLFEDNFDSDLYNEYADDNMKLNDSVLNIDEYIDKGNRSNSSYKQEATQEEDNNINNNNGSRNSQIEEIRENSKNEDNEENNEREENEENEEYEEEEEDNKDKSNNNNSSTNLNENDDSLSMNNFSIDD